MSIYREHGHVSRDAYLESLAEVYEVDIDTVYLLAELLGENEDFDGLITSLQDISDGEM